MDLNISGHFDEYGFPYLNLLVLNKKKSLSMLVKAIIDTGAAHCLIRESLATQLQLDVLRTADYRHPIFGKMPLQEFIMDVSFDGKAQNSGALVEEIRAGTLIDPHYPASVIIGVEVLRHCSFVYNGQQQTFTFRIQN